MKIIIHIVVTLFLIVINVQAQTTQFTVEQQEYLAKKKKLTMCVDPNWMPIEKIKDAKYVGIGADLMRLLSKKMGIEFELVPTQTWDESLQKAQKRECDIVALAQKTPSREQYLDFSTPLFRTPIVVITKTGLPFVDAIKTIQDKPLGIVKNYSFEETLTMHYEGINLIEVASVQDGISRVQSGEVYGFLGNSIVLNYELQKKRINDVSITGQFDEEIVLGVASRNDEMILGEIINSALRTLDKKIQNQIYENWKHKDYRSPYDYNFMLKATSLFFLILSVFAYWNYKLQKEIKKKEKMKQALEHSEEKWRTLVDIAPVLINAFDKNGKLIFWNKECERVFAWSFDELEQLQNPLEKFYPNEQDREEVLIYNIQGEQSVYKEWHPYTKDGRKLITMWAKSTLPSNEVINIGYDVTQQRADALALKQKTQELTLAKQELEKLNTTLEQRVDEEKKKNAKHQLLLMQQNRLVQMGEMIENIAHQWRQPLAQINSIVLLMDMHLSRIDAVKKEKVEKNLSEIESLTHYMSKTIDDFKNFFNPQQEKRDFYMHELVDNVYKILRGALQSDFITLQIDVDENFIYNGYMHELEQVLVTLLNNAKDACVIQKRKDPWIRIDVELNDGYYSIKVIDNGGGILQENLEKIFEPYFSTKHKSQGTGLGLYMAKMIVEDGFGGMLRASNTQDGACFEILLKEKGRDE